MAEELSPILQYTRILHREGAAVGKESQAAREFYEAHRDDAEFRRHAELLHRLMAAKSVPVAASR